MVILYRVAKPILSVAHRVAITKLKKLKITVDTDI